jgi:hypothetical protein
MMTENNYIVKKVSITETLKNLPVGKPVLLDCREAGSMASAKSAVCRLNAAAGKEVYTISTEDNGATFRVLRKE